jgi:hypothetical protein
MADLDRTTEDIEIDVTIFNGERRRYYVEAGNAVYDERGYVHMMSFYVNQGDGDMINLALLPKNMTRAMVRKWLGDWLIPFGLVLSAGKILQGSKVITNLVRFIGIKLATDPISASIASANVRDSVYYTTDTNELIISHPVRLNDYRNAQT